jgi:hypothetical protein
MVVVVFVDKIDFEDVLGKTVVVELVVVWIGTFVVLEWKKYF